MSTYAPVVLQCREICLTDQQTHNFKDIIVSKSTGSTFLFL